MFFTSHLTSSLLVSSFCGNFFSFLLMALLKIIFYSHRAIFRNFNLHCWNIKQWSWTAATQDRSEWFSIKDQSNRENAKINSLSLRTLIVTHFVELLKISQLTRKDSQLWKFWCCNEHSKAIYESQIKKFACCILWI